MKRRFFLTVACATLLAAACSKDESGEAAAPTPGQADSAYTPGCYRPGRLPATLTENSETQYFAWDDGEEPRLTAMGPDGRAGTFEYDGLGRQISVSRPATSISGAQTLRFEYSGDCLSRLTLTGSSGATLLSATTAYSGNRLQTVRYDEIDKSMITGYLNDFLNSRRKDFVDNILISNLQSDYTWTGSTVSGEHLTATGSTDLAIGELVQQLNLDTSFYRTVIETTDLGSQLPGVTPQLLKSFVDMLADSSCHIDVDIDLTLHYRYDGHPNPLYGFWGWGFLGNTRVLSSSNITAVEREGVATATVGFNLPASVPDSYDPATRIALTLALAYLNSRYPDGFRFSYPYALDGSTSYTYDYDPAGWPVGCTDDRQQTTSFTYND